MKTNHSKIESLHLGMEVISVPKILIRGELVLEEI